MPNLFTFKSYCWNIGTTSFRMNNFHRQVEKQLMLLDAFWHEDNNLSEQWSYGRTQNTELQARYYQFLYDNKFVSGDILDDIDSQTKTARQKTSGLSEIGLIDRQRRITDVGEKLLEIVRSGDFSCDNGFNIPKDSFLYFKQLLKTVTTTANGSVKPYLVLGKLLSKCDWYLSFDEFTYLAPLCTTNALTDLMIEYIRYIRSGTLTIDDAIDEFVLHHFSYPAAQQYFLEREKNDDVIMECGMNRDGIRHDRPYVNLYWSLKKVFLQRLDSGLPELISSLKQVNGKAGTYWRRIIFGGLQRPRVLANLPDSPFKRVTSNVEFDKLFFYYLHIAKIRATLSDYFDLNRRYLKITDSITFEDEQIRFTPVFESYFRTSAGEVFDNAFTPNDNLSCDCDLSDIDSVLVFDESSILAEYNQRNNVELTELNDVYSNEELNKYIRFKKLINDKFNTPNLLDLLDKIQNRSDVNDKKICDVVSNDADVPTIFEYLVGIIWYKISGYQGKILDYMKLSLDADLLPRTHAGGGASDIIYKYPRSGNYPKHDLLIECTIAQGTGQRHMEMEPVSRHLAMYRINENNDTYCTFVSNELNAMVISDFRGRKFTPFYINDTEHVDSMKILMLDVEDLKNILVKDMEYKDVYSILDMAYSDITITAPPQWYKRMIKEKIANFVDEISVVEELSIAAEPRNN